MSDSETIEQAADEYQTYRVLSDEKDFELPIIDIHFTADSACYIEVAIDDVPFYFEFSTSKIAPHENYVVLDALTDTNQVTKENLRSQTITAHIEEDLEDAIIKTDTTNITLPLVRNLPEEYETENNTTQHDWEQLDRKCAISTWYYTSDSLETEKARQTQIERIDTVTKETIKLSITLGRTETTVHLPRPENADTNSDMSAEFIEDCSGDIRLLDGETIVLIPENTLIRTEKDGFETEDGLFSIYSVPQYESYVRDYSANSSSTQTNTPSSNTSPFRNRTGKTLTKAGLHGIFVWGAYQLIFKPLFMEDILMASETASMDMMLSMTNYLMELMLVIGIVSLVGGISIKSLSN